MLSKIARILSFFDAEWLNYFRYEWQRNPVRALGASLKILISSSSWFVKRFLSSMRIRLGNKMCPPSTTKPKWSEEMLAESRQSPYLFSPDEMTIITDYARQHLNGEVQTLLSQADQLRDGIFPFMSGMEFKFAWGTDWRYPFPDIEQLFYLNRWYFGTCLAKAFAYTKREAYAERFVGLLHDWSFSNPPDTSGPVWESYSVSERIANWIFQDRLLDGSRSYQERGQPLLTRLLVEHALYLATHLEDQIIHNHLINNGRALFIYGLTFPHLPHAAKLKQMGWQILMREWERQFHQDKMLGEQSTHYHLLLLSRYAEIILLAQRNQHPVPQTLLEALKKMFEVGNHFIRPDGTLAIVGDVSPDSDPSALMGILSVGNVVFGVPSSVSPNEFALWFVGREGIPKLKLAEESGPSLIHLSSSGYVILKRPDLHFVMQCDPRAEVIRHGHQDVLGVHWWVRGRPILIDPGNSSFTDLKWERYFRGPYAHNTVVIDGLPPYIRSETLRQMLPREYWQAKSTITPVLGDNGLVKIQAEHTGYQRVIPPVTVRREVVIQESESLLIIDALEGEGSHQAEVLFQLGSNNVQWEKESQDLQLFDRSGEEIGLITFRSNRPLSIKIHKARLDPFVRGWMSSSYGKIQEATTVICQLQMNGPTNLNTHFLLHHVRH